MKFWPQPLRDIRKHFSTSQIEKHLFNPYLVTAVLSWGLWQVGVWATLELLGFNLLFNIRTRISNHNWDERIVIISIDDKTLAEYGEFPISRDRYTQLLDTLAPSFPAAIGFDILFIEPTIHDQTLAEAMELSGNVVLAISPTSQQKTIRPIRELNQVTTQGHIASNPDMDGVTRQSYIYIDKIPALSVQLLETYNYSLESTITANSQISQKSTVKIPKPQLNNPLQSIWINWIAPTHKFTTYSFVDVIENKIDANELTDKIILVGLTATGTNDQLKTPFEKIPPTSGIYLHAAVIDNLLNQRNLEILPWQIEIFTLLIIGTGSIFIILPLKPCQRIYILLFLPLSWLAISIFTLTNFNLLLPTTSPIITIFLAAFTVQWQEQNEKQQLMNLFARHVSPETANLIWDNRSEIFQKGKLEAQEMVATVLFSDIRNFTSISEGMKPKNLLDWLNYYLSAMAECVHEYNGIVDKYIGDAVMAVFGIPFPHHNSAKIEKDAINAVSAAIAMQKRLITLNQELEKLGKPRIYIGIGIHTGLVVAGSIGGSERLNYSVLGDAVNIAARLEQLNKKIQQNNPYSILISETTFQLVKKHFITQNVNQIQLRGREKLTMIYSVIGYKNEEFNDEQIMMKHKSTETTGQQSHQLRSQR
ncbi:MAG: adenylate/guanylate cyclase domain-containing protein [Sphaerospermopsis sp. SIO1G2]|nr:adenylate/guanylate cyclase domain-containing protein [Sphaerospermopsis sp. SIO1G1]NET72957.1 adenylate/guanylate cyclase domain-containing protein [Sphaerospermopsis sp. SIO1G2]